MKNLITVCLMAFFGLFGMASLHAQNDNPWFGVRAGTVISKANFEGGMLDVDSKSKFGFDLAAVFDFPIGDVFSFGPEVHWVQRNTEAEGATENEGFTQKLDYIHVPVLVRLHFGRPSGLQVFAGPSLDYLLDAKIDYNDETRDDLDSKDNYTELTFGGVLGAGIQLGPVLLDVRYNIGFGDIYDTDVNDLDIKTQDFGAGLTFMF
jgi:hypothetical protein